MPLAHLPPYYAPPGGLVQTVGAAHTRVRHVAGGAGDAYGLTPAPQPQSVGSPPPVKAKPLRGCFASLDRFPAPSASDRFATPKEMEGVKGDAVVHFTLDALESTQHSAQGNVDRFCHMPLRPPEVSGVWGKAPGSLNSPQQCNLTT